MTTDTIVAQATAPGRGGVGIIRISGDKASDVAMAVLGHLPKTRYADYCDFKSASGQVIDQGIALFLKDRIPLLAKMSWNFKATAAKLSSTC